MEYKGATGAKQFNSFNDFQILAIYCNYSYGFKTVRNVIEMALKSLFFATKSEKSLSYWELCFQAPFVIHLSCIGLFSAGPKLDNLRAKKQQQLFVQAPSVLEKPNCASGRIHCCRQIFQAIIWAAYKTSLETLLAYTSFWNMNTKLLK